jgi:hypothetical protein
VDCGVEFKCLQPVGAAYRPLIGRFRLTRSFPAVTSSKEGFQSLSSTATYFHPGPIGTASSPAGGSLMCVFALLVFEYLHLMCFRIRVRCLIPAKTSSIYLIHKSSAYLGTRRWGLLTAVQTEAAEDVLLGPCRSEYSGDTGTSVVIARSEYPVP